VRRPHKKTNLKSETYLEPDLSHTARIRASTNTLPISVASVQTIASRKCRPIPTSGM